MIKSYFCRFNRIGKLIAKDNNPTLVGLLLLYLSILSLLTYNTSMNSLITPSPASALQI